MWSDFLRFLQRLAGLGPRRISMDPEFEEERIRAARRTRLLVLLLIVGLTGAYFAARPVSRWIKGRHADGLVQQGEAAFAAGEMEEAMRQLEAAGALSPVRPSVVRLRARLMTAHNHPGAPAAWEDLVKAAPQDEALRVEWAIALVRADQPAAAATVFAPVGPTARASARGQIAEGLLAIAKGDTRSAEKALRAARQLDPTDLFTRLELGRLLLGTPSSAEGQALIQDLRQNPRFHRPASLLLIDHFRRRADLPAALTLARQLAEGSQTDAADVPRMLDLLTEMRDENGLETALAEAMPKVLQDRKAALALLSWLVEKKQNDRAQAFLGALSPEVWRSREFLPVVALLVTGQSSEAPRLRDLLRQADWTGLEALRAACSARQAEWDGQADARRERWGKAESAAQGNRLLLLFLRRLTKDWGWSKEHLWVLQELAALAPTDLPTLRAWYLQAASQRSTTGVADATRALLAAGDDSLVVRNDFAAASLILGQELPRAGQIALENFTTHPNSLIVVGTYAGSLRIMGRPADALAVLDGAATRGLQHGALTFERALALQALGRREEAIRLVKELPPADRLPEHEALLAKLLKE